MKFFTSLIFMVLVLCSCLAPVVNPTAAPESYGEQKFISECKQGYWTGNAIAFREIENVQPSSCQTYTLVTFKPTTDKTSRISGLNLELNKECVTIDSVVTEINIYERLRCTFDNDKNVLNIYLRGEEIVVITEVTSDGKPFYFAPIGVEK